MHRGGEKTVTPILKELLHSYGLLYVTILTLQKERPRTTRSSTNDHYAGLGRAESGEPVLVVRISQDGESRIADLDAEHLLI